MTRTSGESTWPDWFRPLRRCHQPSTSELKSLLSGDEPVLLTGLIGEWPALRRWTPRWLAQEVGDRPIQALMDLPTEGVLYAKDQDDYLRSMSFADFVQHMETVPNTQPCYLAYTRATDIFEHLRRDYDFDAITGGGQAKTDTRIWIGSGGTRSLLHSDLKPNLFAQLYGRKEALLVPFADSRYVYPFTDNLVNSRIDPDVIDLRAFPKFRRARVYSVLVEPGEIVFIPAGCWHYFRATEPSISLNHWFGEDLAVRDLLKLLVKLGPEHWAAVGRDFVRHGVLGRREVRNFFFSPRSTGKRIFDLLTSGDFSKESDPTKTSGPDG